MSSLRRQRHEGRVGRCDLGDADSGDAVDRIKADVAKLARASFDGAGGERDRRVFAADRPDDRAQFAVAGRRPCRDGRASALDADRAPLAVGVAPLD